MERAGWVVFAGMYYVLGHTIEEQAQEQLARHGNDWRTRATRSPPADPLFARALDSVIATDPADRFAYGLELFIDGIRQQVPSTRQRAVAPAASRRALERGRRAAARRRARRTDPATELAAE